MDAGAGLTVDQESMVEALKLMVEMARQDRKLRLALRQVLMQDLGLTRELVRTETVAIVEAEVRKRMDAREMENRVAKLIDEAVDRALRNAFNGTRPLHEMVLRVAATQVEQLLKDKLTIEVKAQ
jgi:hypothetical protein